MIKTDLIFKDYSGFVFYVNGDRVVTVIHLDFLIIEQGANIE